MRTSLWTGDFCGHSRCLFGGNSEESRSRRFAFFVIKQSYDRRAIGYGHSPLIFVRFFDFFFDVGFHLGDLIDGEDGELNGDNNECDNDEDCKQTLPHDLEGSEDIRHIHRS